MNRPRARVIRLFRDERLLFWIFVSSVFFLLPEWCDARWLRILSRIALYSIMIMSLDLVVGYAGLPSFYHTAFWGISGYTVAALQVHFGWQHPWYAVLIGIVFAAGLALLYSVLSLHTSGLYFLLLSLALGQIFWGMVYTGTGPLASITGASDGIHGISVEHLPFGFGMNARAFARFCGLIAMSLLIAMRILVNTYYGKVVIATSQNRIRCEALGYNVRVHLCFLMVLSGAMAGVSGALFAYHNGFVSPEGVSVEQTGMLWLMLLVGGPRSLYGSFLGSATVVLLQEFVSEAWAERWPLVFGTFLVTVVVVIKKGLWNLCSKNRW